MIQVIEKKENGIDLISMKSDALEVVVSNFGCTIIKILMANKNGHIDDVVLGYDDFTCYQTMDAYLGALVGRVANRIGKGQFSLNGKEYQLAVNNGPNHLHGGIQGFSYQVFDYHIQDENTLVFHYVSKDGEEGYPGTLTLQVFYQLHHDTLTIRYVAKSDADTLLNITNHSYFNLSGKKENINAHTLQVQADLHACIDADGLPTGEFREVKNTAFDFNQPACIGERLQQEDPQLVLGNGFDHPFIFNAKEKQVVLSHEKSGRSLIVSTTLPGAQIYTANYLDGRLGKDGQHYHARDGICIETQYLPDAIHLEEKPSTILRKGETYDETTSYTFKVKTDETSQFSH